MVWECSGVEHDNIGEIFKAGLSHGVKHLASAILKFKINTDPREAFFVSVTQPYASHGELFRVYYCWSMKNASW